MVRFVRVLIETAPQIARGFLGRALWVSRVAEGDPGMMVAGLTALAAASVARSGVTLLQGRRHS